MMQAVSCTPVSADEFTDESLEQAVSDFRKALASIRGNQSSVGTYVTSTRAPQLLNGRTPRRDEPLDDALVVSVDSGVLPSADGAVIRGRQPAPRTRAAARRARSGGGTPGSR